MNEQPEGTEKAETAVEHLYRMKEKGFLFHGTGYEGQIESFIPRKANDPNDEWNSDTAVYATNEPVLSAIFAVYKGKESWGTQTASNEKGIVKVIAKIPASYQNELEKEHGYVYVLPSTSFSRRDVHDPQFKSLVAVTPIERIVVTLNDYLSMGGTIEWISK
ncbi:hypothetical protein KBD68_03080 [Candidatus Woesebacteria bacterium]|nr:hypothetical protein [Candidatus Woesebacteria bacterium]